MQDSHVRDSHAANEGIVKPVDEWTVMPPLDYNCRCYLEQTTDPPNDRKLSQYNDTIASNAALSERIFKDTHPYNKRVAETLKADRRETFDAAVQLAKQDAPYNATIKVGERTIYVNDFADHNDLADNIEAAKKIAPALNKDIYIRHHTDGGKLKGSTNAEFGIGRTNILGDLKTYTDASNSFKNFFNNVAKSADKQHCKYAILDITKAVDIKLLGRHLKGTIINTGKEKNRYIEYFIIIRGNKVGKITRKQLLANKFDSLLDLQ